MAPESQQGCLGAGQGRTHSRDGAQGCGVVAAGAQGHAAALEAGAAFDFSPRLPAGRHVHTSIPSLQRSPVQGRHNLKDEGSSNRIFSDT